MDIMLTLPEEQLLFYTRHINDKYLREKARKKGYRELYELLGDHQQNQIKNIDLEPAEESLYSF